MKRKIFLHVLAALLVVLLVSPMASALTEQQELSLQTGQRSRVFPDNPFTLPEPDKGLRLLHPDTRNAAWMIARNTLSRFTGGQGSVNDMRRIFEYAPIVTDEELPAPVPEGNFILYVLTKGFRNIYFALRATDDPDIWQFVTMHTTADSQVQFIAQNIYYNAATDWIYSNGGGGLMGIGFDYNLDYLIRTAPNAWQADIGFSRLVEETIAPLAGYNLDTLRFPFDYAGQGWMVQLWKGLYGPANGGEIGLYELTSWLPFHMDASNTRLEMTLQIYQDETLFIDHGPETTWWLGAFRYGSKRGTPLLEPRQLRMTGSVLFEDEAMLEAFLLSFGENAPENITGEAEGLLFTFDWY